MTRSRAATSIQSSARSGERRQAAAPRANAPRLSKRAQERALREQRAAAAAQRPEAGIMGMLQPLLLRVRQPPPAGALARPPPPRCDSPCCVSRCERPTSGSGRTTRSSAPS